MRIIIPARKGSKGFPRKNLKLFEYTAVTIPEDLKSQVTVLTDDPEIQDLCKKWNFESVDRPEEVSNDTASTKSLIKWYIDHHIQSEQMDQNSPMIVLYLTYPERTWNDVELAISLFKERGSTSLLCKKEIKTSPFLILKEEEDLRGSQLFYHDLYRRQDYPKCFELSHYICIIDLRNINKLNNNLYDEFTIFMSVNPYTIDVDLEKDFDNLNGISR
jgi:CMP-N-acetylneuraminic acid synthetase